MTSTDIPACLLEVLAAHESFRRLGFTPDEIYLRPQRDRIFVTVRRSGMEFNADIAANTIANADLPRVWGEAAAWWNTHEDEAKDIYERSETRKNTVGLVTALVAHGFNLRKVDA